MEPGEAIPVRDTTTGKVMRVPGFLIEAQTLEGLSGAPVFVRWTTRVTVGGDSFMAYADDGRLLGVWCGSWDRLAGKTIGEGLEKDMTVPVGMGVVTPAPYLVEILNCPELRGEREEQAAKDLASG
jgi:hypothetical protein